MKIINRILIFLSFGGLSFQNADSKFQKFVHIFWSSFITILVSGVWVYLYEHLSNLTTVFKQFLFGIGIAMVLSKSFLYIPHKKMYLRLYNVLQTNAILRTNIGSKFYQIAEKQTNYFFVCIGTTTCFTAFYMIVEPLIRILYKYKKGTLSSDDLIHPVPTTFFFDNKSSPGYEISYIIFIMSWIGCCLFAVGLDSLFIGIGFYIVAGYKDLQTMILELDDIIMDEEMIITKSISFYKKIVNCIQYQNFMLECQNMLQDVNTTIIFATAVGVSVILCSNLFRLSNASADEFLFLTTLAIAANLMLLAYIIVGDLISTEGLNVAKTAYNGLWYLCLANERKYYLQLIQFSQKTRFINGLYFFDCSLETFSKIVQASFSFTAIMRNMD